MSLKCKKCNNIQIEPSLQCPVCGKKHSKGVILKAQRKKTVEEILSQYSQVLNFKDYLQDVLSAYLYPTQIALNGPRAKYQKLSASVVNVAYQKGLLCLEEFHVLNDLVYPNGVLKRYETVDNPTAQVIAQAILALNRLGKARYKGMFVSEEEYFAHHLAKGKIKLSGKILHVSSHTLQDKFDKLRLLIAAICISDICVNSDLTVFLCVFNKVGSFPQNLATILPVKRDKKACGAMIYHIDFEKSEALLNKCLGIDLSLNRKYSRDNLLSVILNSELGGGLEQLHPIAKRLLSKLNRSGQEKCHITFEKCYCESIVRDSTTSSVLEALKEDMITDNEIIGYLKNNPETPERKPFGEPQSKFRNGTYGLHGMEINRWRR
ncbi:hypothetical protein [Vibrio sp. OPT18]|uniref:hypothetical protein n=1 Tax=Vibrio sp. OPT18 TaxID=2778641 RepID=UPI001D13FF17|nr:hypothetical protein [Vibrio sp. OPT18]